MIQENESLLQYSSKFANRISLVTATFIFVLILILNQGKDYIAMTDVRFAFADIGIILLLIGTLFTVPISYFFSIKAWNIKAPLSMRKSWAFSIIFVTLAYTLLIAYVTEFMLFLADKAFPLLELHKYQAAGITAIIGAIIINWVIKHAMNLNVKTALVLVSTLLGLGVYLTMVRIDDPLWWEISLSYLGTMDSNSNRLFNITLAVSGMMIIVWANIFVLELKILERFDMMKEKHRYFIHYFLIALGIAISIIGLFPSRASTFSSFMHNWAAYSLGVILGFLMLGSHWLFSKYPKEFQKTTFMIVGALIIVLLSAATYYINTVGLELMSFVFGLSWLMKLADYTEDISHAKSPESFPV